MVSEAVQGLEELARAFLDFPTFCSLISIPTKDGGLMPFSRSNWYVEQKIFENERTGRDLVLKARQVGFSTIELARDLHYALTHEGVQVQITSHDKTLAENMFLVLRVMYTSLREQGLAPKTRYDNVRELFFEGLQSAIRVSESGATEKAAKKKGRSGTIHRLHCTEVAFWDSPNATMNALLNCVPASGEIVIESTPNGSAGLFYDLCVSGMSGKGDYKFHFYPWFYHEEYTEEPKENPLVVRDEWESILKNAGCSDGQIQWWRSRVENPALGLEATLQEYPLDPNSCFRSAGRSLFHQTVLDYVASSIYEPLRIDRDIKIYREPKPSLKYIIGADVAEGVGGDKSAATVLEEKSGDVVAYFESKTISPSAFGVLLGGLAKFYNMAIIAPERNNHGHAVIESLSGRVKYPESRIYAAEDKRLGWVTTPNTRPVLWEDLAFDLRGRHTTTPVQEHLVELRGLIIDKDGKPRAKNKDQTDGCKDDGYVSWAIARQVRSRKIKDVRDLQFDAKGF